MGKIDEGEALTELELAGKMGLSYGGYKRGGRVGNCEVRRRGRKRRGNGWE